jgi:hypothetical protein
MAYILDEAIIQERSSDLHSWPDDLIEATNLLFVSDFPLSSPDRYLDEYASNPYLPFSIVENGSKSKKFTIAFLRKTKAYVWLISELNKAEDKQLYFGALTEKLHSVIADDPVPYRRDIKGLLSNLLQYVEYFGLDEIEVSRPRHSQLVRLK